MAIAPGTLMGTYRIERLIGRGGMGVVYEATQLSLDRRLALKVLHPELGEDPAFLERFRREGRLQAALDHPHVVTVHEAGESEHGLFLAMRLVHGSSLAALLREGALDAARALKLLRQVAGALDAAHAAGLVHRDAKPRNVLVDPDDRAYLADFGLTRIGGESALTASGELVGTVAYLAPEIVRGGEATPASDRYAFAAMLFECLAGEPVFPRSSDAAVLYAHASEPPPRISDRRPELPAALNRAFEQALAKEPTRRPETARAIVDSVERAVGPETIAALGSPPRPRLPEPGETTPSPRPRTVIGRRLGSVRVPQVAAVVLVAAALSAVVTGFIVSAVTGGSAGEAVPAVPAGAVPLGSDLSRAGVPVDCRGRTASFASPPCSIIQAALPGAKLVAAQDGAVFGWTVRGARGELALQVLRRRESKTFQIARSQYEIVPDERPHHYATNLEVERGDVIGIEVSGGASIGVRRGARGAGTERWFPPLRGYEQKPDVGPGTGFDHEVLVRIDYFPGRRRQLPEQVLLPEAATLPVGKVRARSRMKLIDGRRLDVLLVEVGSRVAFDLFRHRRRVARAFVPDLRPGGEILDFGAHAYEDDPSGDAGVAWLNPNSGRFLEHYFVVVPREFQFIG
jgi:protein kinase-like protein